MQEIFVQMALKAWDTQIGRTSSFFASQTDEDLFKQIAPGKNRIIYLMGHLIAVNDTMMHLFGFGERRHAGLDEPFVKNPDNTGFDFPDAPTLREWWSKSNEELTAHFKQMPAAEWFGRHAAMTDEDLAKDPARNKLSVLLNRTGHVAYHLGQLVLAK